jgi:GT2 family glycosyltransferase
MDVSIVIAAHDAERTLPLALRACRDQDLEGALEVIVVDDGSRDRTATVAESAGARVVRQENAGPAAARNRGWREAAAPIVLFTDADCVPRRDWARRLSRAIDDRFAVAGGSYGIANPGHPLAEIVHAEILWRHARLPESVEFAGSYNLGARRSALERVGGFDESFPVPSAEDNDLSYRLRDAGFAIRFVREAIVDHHHPVSLTRYLREQSRHGTWRVFLYGTHPGRLRGDGYSGPTDFVAPPLAMLSLAWLPFAWVHPGLLAASALAFSLVVALSSLLAVRVSMYHGSAAPLALAPLAALRAYARGWGMVKGVVALLTGRRPRR